MVLCVGVGGTPPSSYAKTSFIDGFQMVSCGVRQCLQVLADEADVATDGQVFGFAQAHVTLTDKQSGRRKEWQVQDSYYDVRLKKVFLREMTGLSLSKTRSVHKKTEAIYDFKTEKLLVF